MKKLVCILLSLAIMLACPMSGFAQSTTDISNAPHVLFLSSYSYEWESIPKQLDGIADTLNGYARIDYVFMDTKRLDYDAVKDTVHDDVLSREQIESYDYVITGDDAALHFVLDYRSELFSGTPVVFEGINSESFAYEAAKDPLITGIVEAFPLEDTIRMAKGINPGATKVVGITDDSTSGKGSTQQFLDCATDFPELSFSTINCSTLTTDEIGKAMSSYSSDTILVYLLMSTDTNGNKYSVAQAVEYVASHASVPVYKADEIGVGNGIMGGVGISYYDMASDAASIVLELSNGADESTYTVHTASSYCVFDKRIMDTYGITKKDISKAYRGDVQYINDTPTYFQAHKSAIIPMAAIILLLLAIVVFAMLFARNNRKLTKQLLEKDRMLNSVLDNMPGGVMVFRLNETKPDVIEPVFFSQGIPKLSGYTEDEYRAMIAHSIFDCGISRDDTSRILDVIAEKVWNKSPVTIHFHQKHANGSMIWIAMSAVWGYDEKDGDRFYYAVFLDVTQQEKAQTAEQEALEARASNEAKSEFLSRMSHDIRTPLNAVIGFASLALDEPDIPPKVADYLKKIDNSGNYLVGLVNDVLDMAKIESGKLELHEEDTNLLDFLEMIAEVFSAQAAERGIKLTTDFSQVQTHWVILDALRTRQICANLLSNAIKFSESGTEIVWTIIDVPVSTDTVRSTCIIKDHGQGMSEEFMERMFSPFEQEKPSSTSTGTGLGLPIVKNLVDMMGGTIHVQSELGQGTTFTISLTRKLGTPQTETQSDINFAALLSGCHILICEDNDINAIVTEKVLESIGCTTDRAENGRLGVEMFEDCAPGTYDAILMDIRMPVMDGLEATRAIRRLVHPEAKTVPIIAMSANVFDEDVEKSLAAGMNAHLAKPIERQELYETLRELIDRDGKET